MKLCVAYPNKHLTYSETFIKNHLIYLKPYLELTGGYIPYYDKNKGSVFIFLLNINLLRGIVKNFFPKIYIKYFQKALKNKLIYEKIDVVLAEYGLTGINVAKICFDLKIPLVVHFHGFDAYFHNTLKTFGKSYRQMFQLASKIIVVSEAMKRQIVSLGCPVEKIVSIPYGVNTEVFKGANPEKSQRTIISVGRFTSKKAPHFVIKAFEIITKTIDDVSLKMIGDGELFEETRMLINSLGLSNRVELLGVKNQTEIIHELTNARVFVQHSLMPENGDSEGMPNTILEAACCGLPIVSTFHAGIPEAVIHNKTGYLVKEGDYKTMALHIIELLQDPILAKEMGTKGQAHVTKNFDSSSQLTKLHNLLLSQSEKK